MRAKVLTVMIISLLVIAEKALSFNVEQTEYWKDKLWFAQRVRADCGLLKCKIAMNIYSYDFKNSKKPSYEFQIKNNVWDLFMIADNDKLWIITDETTGYYNDNEYIELACKESVNNNIFLYRGNPHAILKYRNRFFIMQFSGTEWKEAHEIKMELNDSYAQMRAIAVSDEIHLFLKHHNVLYHHKGIPDEKIVDFESWAALGDVGTNWLLSVIDDKPVVFSNDNNDSGSNIEGNYVTEKGLINYVSFNKYQKVINKNFNLFYIDDNEYLIIKDTIFKASGTLFDNNELKMTYKFGRISRIGAALLFIAISSILFIICCAIAIVNRKWRYKYSITAYKETRYYAKGMVNIKDIMNRDYTKATNSIIKARKNQNALTISTSVFSHYKNIISFNNNSFIHILYFHEEADKIKIQYECKIENMLLTIYLLLIVNMLVAFSMLTNTVPFSNILSIVIYLLSLTVFIMTIMTLKSDKEAFKSYLNLLVVYLGFEENVDVSKLI